MTGHGPFTECTKPWLRIEPCNKIFRFSRAQQIDLDDHETSYSKYGGAIIDQINLEKQCSCGLMLVFSYL